jgi:hypothetical protein
LHLDPWILKSIYRSILSPPFFCGLNPPVVPNCKSNSSEPLQFSKEDPRTFQNFELVPRTSIVDIFSTVTPNQVILVPNFSESHPLSLQAIPMLMIIAFVLLYA